MTHQFIFDKFKEIMPEYADSALAWYSNGRNSIRVITNGKREFIFSYDNNKEWCFETISKYNKQLKKKEDKR